MVPSATARAIFPVVAVRWSPTRRLRKREAAQFSLSGRREDGTTFRNDLGTELQFSAFGRATHCTGTLPDMEHADRAAPKRLRGDHIDRLTGVASTDLFHDQFAEMLRCEGRHHTLLARIDIRRFHDINTSFGYSAGDSLLREIGHRLRKLPDAAIGRLGGDEFAVALPLPDPDAAKSTVAALHALLGAEFPLPDAPFKVRFAIGYAVGQRGDEAALTGSARRYGLARSQGVAVR